MKQAPDCSMMGQADTVEDGEEKSVCLPFSRGHQTSSMARIENGTLYNTSVSLFWEATRLTKNRPGDGCARESGVLERGGAAGVLYEAGSVENNWLPTSGKLCSPHRYTWQIRQDRLSLPSTMAESHIQRNTFPGTLGFQAPAAWG